MSAKYYLTRDKYENTYFGIRAGYKIGTMSYFDSNKVGHWITLSSNTIESYLNYYVNGEVITECASEEELINTYKLLVSV